MKNISHPGQRKIIAQPCSGIILLPKTSIFRSFLGLWGGNPLRKTIMWGEFPRTVGRYDLLRMFFPSREQSYLTLGKGKSSTQKVPARMGYVAQEGSWLCGGFKQFVSRFAPI